MDGRYIPGLITWVTSSRKLLLLEMCTDANVGCSIQKVPSQVVLQCEALSDQGAYVTRGKEEP